MQEISVRLRETPRVPDQMSDAQGIPPRGQNNIVRSRDRDPRRFGNDARLAHSGLRLLRVMPGGRRARHSVVDRSEEHTSELQSLTNLVCRLLLEKKKHHSLPNETAT